MQVNQSVKGIIPNLKPVFISNDYNVQLAACYAGFGAMVLPQEFETCEFLNGLTALPLDLGVDNCGELHLVVHQRKKHLAKIQTVTDRLQTYLSRPWP
jgi:DNA-binding transcriptional LysR family regulator